MCTVLAADVIVCGWLAIPKFLPGEGGPPPALPPRPCWSPAPVPPFSHILRLGPFQVLICDALQLVALKLVFPGDIQQGLCRLGKPFAWACGTGTGQCRGEVQGWKSPFPLLAGTWAGGKIPLDLGRKKPNSPPPREGEGRKWPLILIICTDLPLGRGRAHAEMGSICGVTTQGVSPSPWGEWTTGSDVYPTSPTSVWADWVRGGLLVPRDGDGSLQVPGPKLEATGAGPLCSPESWTPERGGGEERGEKEAEGCLASLSQTN